VWNGRLNGALHPTTLMPLVSAKTLGGFCLSGCFNRPQHVAINPSEPRRRAPNLSVRHGSASGSEAEQRLKGGHRLPPTIVPKDELVEVDLKLRLTDAMIRADQLLQVADRAIRERHHGGRALAQGATERLGTPNMFDARCRQVVKAFQAVGVDRRSRTHVLLDERDHRGLF
jgi:hypothetical protein